MSSACDSCSSTECSAKDQRENENSEQFLERQEIAQRMCKITNKIAVISGKGGGQKIADAFELPLLGSIPLDPNIGKSGDEGKPFIYHYAKTETAQKMKTVIDTIETLIEKEKPMRFAIPLAEGKLTMHFGHCDQFAVIDTDSEGKITAEEKRTPPPHEPGVLPKWIGEDVKADIVLAGGMGIKAQEIIAKHNVKVIVGCEPKLPQELIADYFAETLTSGANACDH